MEEYYEEEEPKFSPERVLTFASWGILAFGALATLLVFAKLCFVTQYHYDIYSGIESTTTEFNPWGLVTGVWRIFMTLIFWAGLRLSVKMSRTLTAIKNK